MPNSRSVSSSLSAFGSRSVTETDGRSTVGSSARKPSSTQKRWKPRMLERARAIDAAVCEARSVARWVATSAAVACSIPVAPSRARSVDS